MAETPQDRLKRMKMRSWRRGTKEMDLILGPYADAQLAGLGAEALEIYEVILAENDHDLLPWILGQRPAPESLAAMIGEIGDFARARLQPQK